MVCRQEIGYWTKSIMWVEHETSRKNNLLKIELHRRLNILRRDEFHYLQAW